MKTPEGRNRAVFLDRDGTICEEVGYMDSLDQMKLIPGSGEAVRLLNEHGFKIVVVTNQAGVARGFVPESILAPLHEEMKRQLKEKGASVDAIYYCPHHPTMGVAPYLTDCSCRKPGTALLEEAAREFDIDLRASYMIGDHYSDIRCGQNAGARTVLLLTGHGKDTLTGRDGWEKPPSHIAADLHEAVQWVLEQERG